MVSSWYFSSETHHAFDNYILNQLARQFIPGYLGVIVNGAWVFDVPSEPGRQYVRIGQGENLTLHKCTNMRVPREPNLKVWLIEQNGELIVDHADAPAARILLGNNVGAAGNPTYVSPTNNDPVIGSRFVPGLLVSSTLGGLNVHVNAFWHVLGFWQGGTVTDGELDPTTHDLDLTSFLPASDGACWVLVYFDPVAEALGAVAGTTYDGAAQQDLDEADIANIALPAGIYPIGAVALTYGQTVIDNTTRFIDARLHHGARAARLPVNTSNVSNPPTDAQLDSAFGTPAAAGAGFAALVNDNAAGTNEYLVWSDGTNWFYVAGTKAT